MQRLGWAAAGRPNVCSWPIVEIQDTTIHSKTTTTKKRPDFQAFLDEVVADVSTDQEIHVILDNYSTHKKNDAWLAAHPNVHFHFTPTSASWLNQVEIWFGILERKTLHGASFASAEQQVNSTF